MSGQRLAHIGLPQPRPAARAGLAAHTPHLLDLCQEPLITQRLVLIQRKPDVVDRRLIQMASKQLAVGRLTRLVGCPMATPPRAPPPRASADSSGSILGEEAGLTVMTALEHRRDGRVGEGHAEHASKKRA